MIVCLFAQRATAYSIGTAFSEPCHESITAAAFAKTPWLWDAAIEPRRAIDAAVGAALLVHVGVAVEDDARTFALMSLIVGVRAPDTEGRSLLELEQTRQVHAAPADQYGHALRAAADDGQAGDERALQGAREQLIALVLAAQLALAAPHDAQFHRTTYTLDFYGPVALEVWRPAWLLGRALHLVQDSFAHTLRTEDPHWVAHVLTYVDALSPMHDDARDGLRHSGRLDACTAETAPLVAAATAASVEVLEVGRLGAAAASLPGEHWLRLEASCSQSRDRCHSPWLQLAGEEVTSPYLGCSIVPTLLPVWAVGLWWLRRGRRRAWW